MTNITHPEVTKAAQRNYQEATKTITFMLLEMTHPSVPEDLRKEVITRCLNCHLSVSMLALGTAALSRVEGAISESSCRAAMKTIAINIKAILDDEDTDKAYLRATLISLLTLTRPDQDYFHLLPEKETDNG